MLATVVLYCLISLHSLPVDATEPVFKKACEAAAVEGSIAAWMHRGRCYVHHYNLYITASGKNYETAKTSCNDLGSEYPGHLAFLWSNDELRATMTTHRSCGYSETWMGMAKTPRGDAANYGKWYWEHPDGRKWLVKEDSREAGYMKYFGSEPVGYTAESCIATMLCPGSLYGAGDYGCYAAINYICEYEPKQSSLHVLAADKRIDPAKLPPAVNYTGVGSIYQCLAKCLLSKNRPICYSVVYGASSGECELHMVNEGSSLLLGADAAYPDAPWAVDAVGYDIYTFA